MDLRRVRTWDWLAGVAGVVLIASLFLHWYKNGVATATAWQAFTVIDIVLLLAGLCGVGIVVASATQRSGAVPQSLSTLSVVPALVAVILVVYRTFSLPPPSALVYPGRTFYAPSSYLAVVRTGGLWVGLAAALGLAVTVWRSMGDQRLPGFSVRDLDITPLPPPTPEGERR